MEIMIHDAIFLRTHKNDRSVGDIWFIHGFGESGFSFVEAFSSIFTRRFSIFVPDFPGFGVSPPRPGGATVEASADILVDLIGAISKPSRPVFLVGHSLGGIIGTATAKKLGHRIAGFVSIEGNMTRADTFMTRLTEGYDDPLAFYDFYLKMILSQIADDVIVQRYFASVRLCDPASLLAAGKSCVAATGEENAGDEYRSLEIETLYLWGGKSIPDMTREYIEKYDVKNHGFPDSEHFAMIDNSDACYGAISNFFLSVG
jgi:pimeloyl-ACP methyl ester carboxylesterase